MRTAIILACCAIFASTAAAADCDINTEVAEVSAAYTAEVERLSADPTDENMGRIAELAARMNEAGQQAGTDPDAACESYAALREMLGM